MATEAQVHARKRRVANPPQDAILPYKERRCTCMSHTHLTAPSAKRTDAAFHRTVINRPVAVRLQERNVMKREQESHWRPWTYIACGYLW